MILKLIELIWPEPDKQTCRRCAEYRECITVKFSEDGQYRFCHDCALEKGYVTDEMIQ